MVACFDRFPQRFSLQGNFLGFVPGKHSPFKYLCLGTLQGEVEIKLSKNSQIEALRYFSVGDRIQVIGERKIKSDGTIRFKAEWVAKLADGATSNNVSADGSNTTPAKVPSVPMVLKLAQQSPPQIGVPPVACPPPTAPKAKILICGKSGCMKRGGTALCQVLEATLAEHGLSDRVDIKLTGCMDHCKGGPNVVFMPGKARYTQVKPRDIPALVHEHIVRQV